MKFDAKYEILKRKYQQYWNLKFELGEMGDNPCGTPYTKLRDEIQQMTQLLWDRDRDKKKTSPYIWLTVSLRSDYPDIDSSFPKALAKFTSRKMFTEYIYAIEQRESEYDPTATFRGQHAHILLRRNQDYCFSQIKRNSKNSWRDWCNVDDSRIFNIHSCPKKFLVDKVNYLMGNKTDPDKPEKVIVDNLWRSALGLKKYYESSNYFSKLIL